MAGSREVARRLVGNTNLQASYRWVIFRRGHYDRISISGPNLQLFTAAARYLPSGKESDRASQERLTAMPKRRANGEGECRFDAERNRWMARLPPDNYGRKGPRKSFLTQKEALKYLEKAKAEREAGIDHSKKDVCNVGCV
jgi:hypothetical protein